MKKVEQTVLQLRLGADEKELLRELAWQRRQTMSELVRSLVRSMASPDAPCVACGRARAKR